MTADALSAFLRRRPACSGGSRGPWAASGFGETHPRVLAGVRLVGWRWWRERAVAVRAARFGQASSAGSNDGTDGGGGATDLDERDRNLRERREYVVWPRGLRSRAVTRSITALFDHGPAEAPLRPYWVGARAPTAGYATRRAHGRSGWRSTPPWPRRFGPAEVGVCMRATSLGRVQHPPETSASSLTKAPAKH